MIPPSVETSRTFEESKKRSAEIYYPSDLLSTLRKPDSRELFILASRSFSFSFLKFLSDTELIYRYCETGGSESQSKGTLYNIIEGVIKIILFLLDPGDRVRNGSGVFRNAFNNFIGNSIALPNCNRETTVMGIYRAQSRHGYTKMEHVLQYDQARVTTRENCLTVRCLPS